MERTYMNAGSEDKREVTLAGFYGRIVAINDLLESITNGVVTTADRIFGAEPMPSTAGKESTPIGQLEEIEQILLRLQHTAQFLGEQASRLYRI